mmetsp:Transcript_55379/g.125263  ORF Transcript_55379/g.125263 Transcript_55379/m.125263 type:complete len:323 (+) Transcript_55379:65-1033(+)
MGRTPRPLALGLVVCVGAWLLLGPGGVGPGPAAFSVRAADQKVVSSILAVQSFLANGLLLLIVVAYRVISNVLPGLLFAGLGYAWYTDRISRKQWGVIGLIMLCCGCVMLLALRAEAPGAGQGLAAGSPQGSALVGQGDVHSGEEVLTEDGRFVRLADPTKAPGSPVEEGWQQHLAGAMATALSRGREQVVLVFSRQGCPWCERQVPVIHEVMQSRAGSISSEPAAPGAAFAAGSSLTGGGNLLFAPLRVFILDAEEFPALAQNFNIQAFPTSLIFGAPRVPPLVAKGYLDEESFEEVLRSQAAAMPSEAGPTRKTRRRFLR